MLEYLNRFFSESEVGTIVTRIVLVLALTLVFFIFFYYAKKRNMQMFTAISVISLVVLFALSFLTTDSMPFFVYALLAALFVLGSLLFIGDFRRDLFRVSLNRWFEKEQEETDIGTEDLHKTSNEIIKACQRLSKTDTGALIIIAENMLDAILDTGTKVNAEITAELLETIFFPKTALHDGAVVITSNKVVAAGCYLPLSQDNNLPKEFGTRHRAAIGVSEAYPSITVLVVSEETGIISAMHDGKIKRYLDVEQLKSILECALHLSDEGAEERIWGLSRNEED